jgi:hypothetical protein
VTAQDETYFLLGREGERESAIANEEGSRVQMMTGPQGPFSRPVLAGFAPAAVSTVGHGRLYHGFSARDEIRVVDPDAALVRIIRRTRAPRPVTGDMIQAQEDWQRQAYRERDPAGLPDLERRLAEAEYPDHVPFFDWFLVDTVGNLWVRNYFIPGGTRATYSVFDEAGSWITELEVPAVGPVGRPAVSDIGDDYVLVRQQDDLGVQSYARYALTKPESP